MQGFIQNFELGGGGGKQDGSRMIVACESTLMDAYRGVWGHNLPPPPPPPKGKF